MYDIKIYEGLTILRGISSIYLTPICANMNAQYKYGTHMQLDLKPNIHFPRNSILC